MTDQTRQPQGSPEGGQFASTAGGEGAADLHAQFTTHTERRADLVGGARDYLARHTCSPCESGNPCDAATYASNVLELDALIDQLPTDSAFDNSPDTALDMAPVDVRAVEAAARADEAAYLTQYVRDAATRATDRDVESALDSVADDLEKGSVTLRYVSEAGDVRTEPGRLDILADYPDRDVQWWVAKNPNTPPSTLGRLALDETSYTARYEALNRTDTPVTALIAALNSRNPTAVLAAAGNTSLPLIHVQQLRSHPEAFVRDYLAGVLARRAGQPKN